MTALVISILAGVSLGAFYFGGLWWTTRRMPATRRPVALYAGSWIVRSAFVVITFLALLRLYDWPFLIGAVLGMMAVRTALISRLGPVGLLDSAKGEAAR